jgi:hypothetical protein
MITRTLKHLLERHVSAGGGACMGMAAEFLQSYSPAQQRDRVKGSTIEIFIDWIQTVSE